MISDATTRKIVATFFGKGSEHDFALFLRSRTHWLSSDRLVADSGYQGLSKIREAQTPFKKKRGQSLSKSERRFNRALSRERIGIEHCFRDLKVFKILSQPYRCHVKRFGLRFNLLCAIYNRDIDNR